MICQRCGVLEATVHFSDPAQSPRRFQWLCSKCADMVVESLVSQSEDDKSKPEDEKPKAWDPTAINADISNSRKGELLGKMFGLTVDDQVSEDISCSQCGLRLQRFRQTGLLGCSQCYEDFREVLRPFLARLHGHTSHLGRIPGQSGAETSPHVQVMRLRVDLEKAIANEDFEKAAILRDEISELRDSMPEKKMGEDGAVS